MLERERERPRGRERDRREYLLLAVQNSMNWPWWCGGGVGEWECGGDGGECGGGGASRGLALTLDRMGLSGGASSNTVNLVTCAPAPTLVFIALPQGPTNHG